MLLLSPGTLCGQRLRCASAIRLRASALSTRFFLGLALAEAFLALRPALVAAVPIVASRERACLSLAISESNWAKNVFYSHSVRIIQKLHICTAFCMEFSALRWNYQNRQAFLLCKGHRLPSICAGLMPLCAGF